MNEKLCEFIWKSKLLSKPKPFISFCKFSNCINGKLFQLSICIAFNSVLSTYWCRLYLRILMLQNINETQNKILGVLLHLKIQEQVNNMELFFKNSDVFLRLKEMCYHVIKPSNIYKHFHVSWQFLTKQYCVWWVERLFVFMTAIEIHSLKFLN